MELTIYTYGTQVMKNGCPYPIDANFDACIGSFKKPRKINLRRNTGKNPDMVDAFMRQRHFQDYVQYLIDLIVLNNYQKIAIHCKKGRHRSASIAEAIKSELSKRNWNVCIVHLCI